MEKLGPILTCIGLGLICLVVVMALLEEANHRNHLNGGQYIMDNGVVGIVIEHSTRSAKEFSTPIIRLQWTSEGKTFKAWFKADEITKVSDVLLDPDHTY